MEPLTSWEIEQILDMVNNKISKLCPQRNTLEWQLYALSAKLQGKTEQHDNE
jgi:hypothetical protein